MSWIFAYALIALTSASSQLELTVEEMENSLILLEALYIKSSPKVWQFDLKVLEPQRTEDYMQGLFEKRTPITVSVEDNLPEIDKLFENFSKRANELEDAVLIERIQELQGLRIERKPEVLLALQADNAIG